MTPRHTLLHLPPRTPAEPAASAWLAEQWQVDVAALPLRRDSRCRPRMIAPMQDFDASWSHSGDQLLVTCGEGLRLGCDLERLRPRPSARALARRYFHADEQVWLDELGDDAAESAFLRLWCAKEAVLKAHGHGLSFGLDRLRFVEGAHGLRLADCDPALGRSEDWRFMELVPASGFIAAIAWHPLPAPESGAAIMPG
ncbi:4'-phosphopantetheinyl transferase family protein [Solilutibacter tolerans]|uniref:4'-phosphopantetheinyl transferase n=1 Tax=Solilutibacter tolerans TaxID=1604334 RepID=A0A1N6RR24_9GAMM|nr:4'-phosphopantetheinyl transferase superfamily protein [Lysobacter tolerans]SIQ31271.1 4'-phosphopantetheinyl transferase [Lysobacter tolerans]